MNVQYHRVARGCNKGRPLPTACSNDNIFYTLHGKADEADAPQLLSYTIDVCSCCRHWPG